MWALRAGGLTTPGGEGLGRLTALCLSVCHRWLLVCLVGQRAPFSGVQGCATTVAMLPRACCHAAAREAQGNMWHANMQASASTTHHTPLPFLCRSYGAEYAGEYISATTGPGALNVGEYWEDLDWEGGSLRGDQSRAVHNICHWIDGTGGRCAAGAGAGWVGD